MKQNKKESEKQLVRMLQAGMHEAFEPLFDRYRKRIISYAAGLTMDRNAAEDIAQDSFIELSKNIDGIDPDKGVSGWLHRVARNKAIDHLRKRKREIVTEEAGRTEAVLKDPSAEAEKTERAGRVRAAMRDLDEEDRDILSMRFYSGLKFREIARIRNEPLGTALWKGRRALERLKGILAEQGSTDEM